MRGAAAQAPLDVANATLIYGQNKVGVQFVPTYQDVSFNATAVATIGSGCNAIGRSALALGIRRTELNVYYVNGPLPQDAPGLNCDHFGDGNIKGDANITFLGARANLASLAHEIGHAFGLRTGAQGGHTNKLKGFNLITSCGVADRPPAAIFRWGRRFA